jgi:hypothetical protein
MPCEILQRRYFGFETKVVIQAGPDGRKRLVAEEGNHPIIHNFLHDIEASFWTGLWIVTCRVNHEPSKDWARPIFQDTPILHLSSERSSAFQDPISEHLDEYLPDQLKDLANPLDFIRHWLFEATKELGRAKAWSMANGCLTYSKVHENVAQVFHELAASLTNESPSWAKVKLQNPISVPQPMDVVLDEGSDAQPVAPEQPVVSNLVEEEGESGFTRRVSPRLKRPHRDGNDESGPSETKRIKSSGGGNKANNGGRKSNSGGRKTGGRTSAPGPSGAPTTAGRGG